MAVTAVDAQPGLGRQRQTNAATLTLGPERADHAWAVRSDAHTTAEPPSALLRRTFVDSLVRTPEQLRHLVASMGTGQVTLGSDYPFDMGVEDPVDHHEAAGFDHTTVDAIRGGNAGRLLGPVSA